MAEKLRYSVITIGREYGAYGRTVASALSERLGIPYYDKDFVRETALRSGYSEEEVAAEGESMSPVSKFMNSLLNNSAYYSSSFDEIFRAEREVMLELAKSPCILVGRCADYVLQEAGIPAFHVFLYADLEVRIRRAAELEENRGLDPRRAVAKRDVLRETFYKVYSGREMKNYQNYHICLDTGVIGPEQCVTILEGILRQ